MSQDEPSKEASELSFSSFFPASLAPLAFIGFAMIAWIYWPSIAKIAEICWNNDDYSHGILLPLISAYLIWEEREKLSKLAVPSGKFSFWSTVSLVLGLFVLLLGIITQSLFIKWASLFPVLLGFIGLLWGFPFLAKIGPMIVLLFMAKPLPDSLVPRLFGPLQRLSAQVSAVVLDLLDVPVLTTGNVIEIPGMKLLVEEACSGLRSVMALLTVALILVCFINLTNLGRALLVFLSVAVAVILNVVRVASTGVLAWFYDPKAASGFFHSFSGMVVFAVGFVILLFIAKLLPTKEASEEPA